MYNGDQFNEPPVDPLADTNPTMTYRPEAQRSQAVAGWRRALGFISLLGMLALTLGTAYLLLRGNNMPETPPPTEPPQISVLPTLTAVPTNTVAPTQETQQENVSQQPAAPPTLSADAIAALLNQPVQSVAYTSEDYTVTRDIYNPFTIIPDRPRNDVFEYTVVEGDTIYSIAERFGLKPETIAWSNDRSITFVLRPGRQINILPVDGVYHTAIGTALNLGDIIRSYGIEDVFSVIDSEYNTNLAGMTPDTIPPSGTHIVIPGGEAEQITWNPGVIREGDDSSGGNGSSGGVAYITFAPGQPGSCGRQPNVGGTFWSQPIFSYTWIRGFSSWHTGADLAAAVGSPVYAANGGTVIFAGWNNFGYGNTIVLAHGPFTTLYGHLSAINVRCGETVVSGQPIGAVGNTGNSSGPHLHFEIRYQDQPQNPTATIAL